MMDNFNAILGNDEMEQERSVAFLMKTAYPELWERFVARCQRENGIKELSPELLNI